MRYILLSSKALILFYLSVLMLVITSQGFTQSVNTPERLENPTILPQNRLTVTTENASNINLLAMWGLGNVSDVAWLDDTHLAIAASSGTWLYDLAVPDVPIAILPSLNRWQSGRHLSLLSVSPDSEWLGVTPNFRRYGDYNAGFELWHIPTGNHIDLGSPIDGQSYLQQVAPILSDEPPPSFVQWLPDNRYLMAYLDNIILWELSPDSASVDMVLNHPRTERTSYHIEQVTVSQDMRWIASVIRADISDQIIVQLWDTHSGKSRVLYEDDFLPEVRLLTRSIQFNADGSEVALALTYPDPPDSYDWEMELWRWSVETGEALSSYPINCDAIKISFTHDNMICRTYHSNGTDSFEIVSLRDSHPLSEPVQIYGTHAGNLQQMSALFDTTDNLIGVPNQRVEHFVNRISPYSAIIWSHDGEQVAGFDLGDDQINGVVISPDETRVALLQFNQVQIWEIETQSYQLTLGQSGLLHITNLATSPDGRYLIAIGAYPDPVFYSRAYPTRTLRWDLQTGIYEVMPNQDAAFAAAYSPNGRQLVLGRSDGKVYLYDAETLALQNVLLNEGHVGQVAFSNDGRLLAVANENYIRLWDTQSLTVINRVQAESGFFFDRLLFTSDDEWLVYNRQVWKIEDGGRLVALWDAEDVNDEVRQLLYDGTDSPTHSYRAEDGLLLRGLNLIDVNQEVQLWSDALFRYQRYEPTAVVLTKDLIIAGTSDGSLRLYGIVPDGE